MSDLVLIRVAFAAVLRHRLRSTLAILGVAIGIGATLCTVALGEGSAAAIHEDLVALGDNLLWVQASVKRAGGVRDRAGGIAATLTAEDSAAIPQEVPEISRCTPQVDSPIQIIHGNRNWRTTYRGVTADYVQVRKWPVEDGDVFTDVDVQQRSKVCLLGRVVADEVFGDENPVGQSVRLGSVPFTVVGVLKPKGQSSVGQDQDDFIILPYTTAIVFFRRTTFIEDIMCSAVSAELLPLAREHLTALLRDRHRRVAGMEDDFDLRTDDDAIRVREEAARTSGLMVSAVALVSLLVGGVGVMNIMLVSVSERTREIGLRMAIGARQRHVRLQFLVEALVIGLLGGAAGLALGVIAARVLTDSLGWPMLISPKAIAIAVTFATGVGLVFGLYPANRASAMDPVEALRFE
ncbi:MAG TPA: ABC transporter permease [Gemmatimonadaceae bacterium]|nr:ABC transporter permease [Gemmatimonadaceae bacterium]